MCNSSCIEFGHRTLSAEEVRGKAVLEVGSRDVNGSLRTHVEGLGPASYLGVDIRTGAGVDEVCPAEEILARYGPESYDLVLCTEVLEHVRDWRPVIHNLKQVLRPGGGLLITTRSQGFPHHGFPFDYWRYELEDMRQIFADCTIEDLAADPEAPGVFIKVRKPEDFVEADLSDLRLYAMSTGRRMREITAHHLRMFKLRLTLRNQASALLPRSLKRLFPDRLKIAFKNLLCRIR